MCISYHSLKYFNLLNVYLINKYNKLYLLEITLECLYIFSYDFELNEYLEKNSRVTDIINPYFIEDILHSFLKIVKIYVLRTLLLVQINRWSAKSVFYPQCYFSMSSRPPENRNIVFDQYLKITHELRRHKDWRYYSTQSLSYHPRSNLHEMKIVTPILGAHNI